MDNPDFLPYLSDVDREARGDCAGSIFGYVVDRAGSIANIDLDHKLVAAPIEDIMKAPHSRQVS